MERYLETLRALLLLVAMALVTPFLLADEALTQDGWQRAEIHGLAEGYNRALVFREGWIGVGERGRLDWFDGASAPLTLQLPGGERLLGLAASDADDAGAVELVVIGEEGAAWWARVGAEQSPVQAQWWRESTGVRVHLRSVAFGSGRFLAVGDQGVVVQRGSGELASWTRDPLAWTAVSEYLDEQPPADFAEALYDVVWTGESFVAVGTHGVVLWSAPVSAADDINSGSDLNGSWYYGQLKTGEWLTGVAVRRSGVYTSSWNGEIYSVSGNTYSSYIPATGGYGDLHFVVQFYTVYTTAFGTPLYGIDSYGGDHLVAVGAAGSVVISDTPGGAWRRERSGTQRPLFGSLWDASTEQLVAFGAGDELRIRKGNISLTSVSRGKGRIEPAEIQVIRGKQGLFKLLPDAGQRIASVRGCPGTLVEDRFITDLILVPCALEVEFEPATTQPEQPALNEINDILVADGQYIAVGNEGRILTSSDGTNWMLRESGTSENLAEIVRGDAGYLVLGWNATLLRSADGIVWSGTRPEGAETLYSLTWYPGDQLYITSDGLTLYLSSDGEIWQPRAFPEQLASRYTHGIYWNDPLGQFLVRVGDEMWRSTDGLEWSADSQLPLVYSYRDLLERDDQIFWPVGYRLYRSEDRIQWTTLEIPSVSLLWNPRQERLESFGEKGEFWTSKNGTSWQRRGMGWYGPKKNLQEAWRDSYERKDGRRLEKVVRSLDDSGYLAIGNGIYHSLDGLAWRDLGGNLKPDAQDSKTIWVESLGLFIRVGLNGLIETSRDSVEWQTRESYTAEYLVGVTWNEETLLALGYDGLLLASDDGIHWQQQARLGRDQNFYNLMLQNGQYLAIGTRNYISSDGLEWQEGEGCCGPLAIYFDGYYYSAGWGFLGRSEDGLSWLYVDHGFEGFPFWEIEGFVQNDNVLVVVGAFDGSFALNHTHNLIWRVPAGEFGLDLDSLYWDSELELFLSYSDDYEADYGIPVGEKVACSSDGLDWTLYPPGTVLTRGGCPAEGGEAMAVEVLDLSDHLWP